MKRDSLKRYLTPAFSRPLACVLVVSASLAACSRRQAPAKPTVTGLQTVASEPAPRASIDPAAHGDARAVVSEVTFVKSEILNRAFLYGSDLQYSAVKDSDMDLTLQSMAMGHVSAEFRLIGSSLQLVADQRASFESDVNHPGRLIQEFPVVRSDADTVTVRIERASPTLVTTVAGASAARERASWVRSVEYVAQGNYLMFETSIEAADGSIAEFMESVFPRDTLVPAGYRALLNDAAREPLADRFRFLGGGKFYKTLDDGTRVQTEAASRFVVPEGKVIEWYVTSNVPDDYLPELRMGVEGWNRYAQAMWGRDLVKFRGRLPNDVKIGDPRYNVINWDSVAEAGAAYESQASDPETGIQSHALIYLPKAWVNIGKEYWEKGRFSDAQEAAPHALGHLLARRSFMGRAMPVHCLYDPTASLSLRPRQDTDDFAKELLKGVLFHEMGHSLGLAHNFKGSLSMDPDHADAPFSASIMDYNQYNIERGAFDSTESEHGPLLEYDRQILSVLYNGAKDVKGADPVIPACADEESDDQKGGVDPLCIRYDAGKDPTQTLASTVRLVSDPAARLGETQSLAQALNEAAGEWGDPAKTTDLEAAAAKLGSQLSAMYGLVNFYIASGANSLNYMARANLRSLYVFKGDSLPAAYDADAMRRRAFEGLNYVATLEKLPDADQGAWDAGVQAARNWFGATAAVQALPEDKRQALTAKVGEALGKVTEQISDKRESLLAKVRAKVVGSLARVATAPFYMARAESGVVDYEIETLKLLERGLTTPVNGQARPLIERAAYATALVTYGDTDEGQRTAERVKAALAQELATVANATLREEIRSILKILNAPKADGAESKKAG